MISIWKNNRLMLDFVGKMCDKSGHAEASGTNTLDTRSCAHLTSRYFNCFLEKV